MDEIGPLELIRGEGWTNAVHALGSRQYDLAILVMRPKLLETALKLWPWGETITIENVILVPEITNQLMNSFT